MVYLDSAYKKARPRIFKSGRQTKPWRALVYHQGRRISLGHYTTEQEARDAVTKEKGRYIDEALEHV